MNRIFLFIILFSFSLFASDTTHVYWLGKPLVYKTVNVITTTPNSQWVDTSVIPVVSIGAGIQTLTFSLSNGAIGLFDILTPINIIFNLYQKEFIQTIAPPINFCFWAPSIGFLITKPSGSSQVTFGLSLIPYQLKINNFSFGIGMAWVNQGTISLNKNNLFVTLPLTYNIDIGK